MERHRLSSASAILDVASLTSDDYEPHRYDTSYRYTCGEFQPRVAMPKAVFAVSRWQLSVSFIPLSAKPVVWNAT